MWSGFRRGKSEAPSSAEIAIEHHGSRMTPRMQAAVTATEERAAAMQPKILEAILLGMPSFRAWKTRKPKLTRANLRDHVRLFDVIISKDHFEGVSYVWYTILTSWDPSAIHVLTHGDRVIAAGDADSNVLDYPQPDPLRSPPAVKPPSAAKLKAARAAADKRAKKNPEVLPEDGEELEIHLPVWAGFVARPHDEISKGEALVELGGDEPDVVIGPAQQAAYAHTVAKAAAMQELVLDAIVKAAPKLARGREYPLPKQIDRKSLATLVELTSLTIHGVAKAGIAYVGYQLACAWDREHGLGVLTHRDRVVAVGQADTAFVAARARAAAKKR